MIVHKLTRADCLALLEGADFGRLGYTRLGQPHIVPIQFAFDAERLCAYGISAVGEKVQCMRMDPRVCLEVDEIVDKDHWTTVVGTGRYDELDRQPRCADGRRRAEALLSARAEWWLPATAKLSGIEPAGAVLFRIKLDNVSGRRACHSRSAAGPAQAIA